MSRLLLNILAHLFQRTSVPEVIRILYYSRGDFPVR